jgi:hypothetical protein
LSQRRYLGLDVARILPKNVRAFSDEGCDLNTATPTAAGINCPSEILFVFDFELGAGIEF